MAEARRLFFGAMDDDFNTAKAIGHLFDLGREVNRGLDEGAARDGSLAARALFDMGQVIGLFWKPPAGERWDADVMALVEAREQARRSRNWKQADELRTQLLERGVLVEDGAEGPRLKRS